MRRPSPRRPAREISLLLRLLDEAYERRAWHGPNLRGSLRGLSAREAAWRPSPRRHNVWELLLHAAYWKYAVRRMLTGGKRGSFPLSGSNWIEPPAPPTAKAWKAHRALLDSEHRRLRGTVAGLTPAELARRPRGSKYDVEKMILGVASHDLYHAGQIQLLKALRRAGRRG